MARRLRGEFSNWKKFPFFLSSSDNISLAQVMPKNATSKVDRYFPANLDCIFSVVLTFQCVYLPHLYWMKSFRI